MAAQFDMVVMGSGAAGLMCALAAADKGARVLVLERASYVGGTTAISGGQIWVPNNHLMLSKGKKDSEARARSYLEELTLGTVALPLLHAFVEAAPRMVSYLETVTKLRFFMVERHDYHSEWSGASYGRSLEPQPLCLDELGIDISKLRRSPSRPPLTSAELKLGKGRELIDQRNKDNQVTQGSALVAGLLAACIQRGVVVQSDCRAHDLIQRDGRVRGVTYRCDGKSVDVFASAVVIASGGFEWNAMLKQAFLKCVDDGAASPPGNEGDGLVMALRAGASLDNMTEAWWSAAYSIPGETYDGQPYTRNIVRELALPGSILVNQDGQRFVNEASSYNDLGKAFHVFDPGRNKYVNKRAWLVFDDNFKRRYPVATIPPSAPAPEWFIRASSIDLLAEKMGVCRAGLYHTVERFNGFAKMGNDLDFHRGIARHDQYHGDLSMSHPNLAELQAAPFYAIPIYLGNLGTKGGMRTSIDGHVLDAKSNPIDGLFACGNAAASWMGPGYPGAGGALGPIMTAAYLCGQSALQ